MTIIPQQRLITPVARRIRKTIKGCEKFTELMAFRGEAFSELAGTFEIKGDSDVRFWPSGVSKSPRITHNEEKTCAKMIASPPHMGPCVKYFLPLYWVCKRWSADLLNRSWHLDVICWTCGSQGARVNTQDALCGHLTNTPSLCAFELLHIF